MSRCHLQGVEWAEIVLCGGDGGGADDRSWSDDGALNQEKVISTISSSELVDVVQAER